jgi:hypothetical protein
MAYFLLCILVQSSNSSATQIKWISEMCYYYQKADNHCQVLYTGFVVEICGWTEAVSIACLLFMHNAQ